MSFNKGSNLGRLVKDAAKLAGTTKRFDIETFLFAKQWDFVKDDCRFKVATCSRRAGKTVACAADLINTCVENQGAVCLYITLNRLSAKRIIWRQMLEIISDYAIDARVNETELMIDFPNTKSQLYITGAKDASEIEKFRGLALKKVYIDEAQSFRSYMRQLIDEVISPALYDYNGSLILIGTPGPVQAGVFYEAFSGAAGMQGFKPFHWTILDNPHIKRKSGKEPADILREELKRRGLDETSPTHMRENLGLWVEDVDALVYRFSSTNGYYDSLPDNKRWEYIIGTDVGYEDADAIAVLAFCRELPTVYLVEEFIQRKQTLEQLAEQLIRLRDKYDPVAMVGDYGSLGKKLFESINSRYHINVKPAEKVRKFEYISLLNDDLRTQRLLVPRGAQVVEDWHKIQWHPDMDPAKPRVDNSFHSDIADAVLYGWREAKHYTYEPPIQQPKPGTPEYVAKQETDMFDKILESRQRESEKEAGTEYIDIEDWDQW